MKKRKYVVTLFYEKWKKKHENHAKKLLLAEIY